nr:retrovirus-related Pol polyprotein from transposon TNT 1-94 [Tanacetum cinerariifolium]
TQLTDYGFHFDKIPMYCDSKAAIAISCNPVHHSCTKHIDVRYHFIKEKVEKGIVELFFVGTEYQLADLFTKALPEERFKYLIKRLGMRCLTPEELKTLHAYFAAEGIQHQTSVARTPKQNGVVERWNRTLVEAARTMLSDTKVPLFFWAEAIATACFTQNRSLVIPHHEKTPYHIINDRKPLVKFFHIFGSVCYIVRDGENLNKIKEKVDECIFVGYSTQSRAYRVFNKRTRVIIESIHVNFDELPQMVLGHNSSDPAPTCQMMASDQHSSDPAPECQTMALEHISLSPGRKCQENASHEDRTVTTSNELDLLFSLMFDELLNGSSKVVSKSSAVSAADAPNKRQHLTTPLTNHTTPAPTCQTPTIAPTALSTENINQVEKHAENDQVVDDEFINIFSTLVQDQGETSSRHVNSLNMHTFYQRYPSEHRWTKDHPLFETYLCKLCGNNSHDGYDCQQQFPFVYEQEPSYNQNYNGNYYPHDSPGCLCCDNCGGSHPTFQCQPMDQNTDSSGFDQIQSPQYPVIHHLSQADVEEVLQDKEKFTQNTQTFLEKFNRYSFGVTPRVLTIAQERIYKIKYVFTEPEEIPELMCKLREDVRNIREELAEHINSPKKSSDVTTPVLPTEEPEYSLSMGYEHFNTTPEMESDEIIKSGVDKLVPIPRECNVTLEDKRECDVLVCEDSSTFDVCDNHSEILSDSNNDDISSDDDAFEDIEYVEATPLDPGLVSLEEENDVYQEEEEFNLEDIQDVILREKLLSINRLIANIKSLNDNPTPDCVLKSFASIPIFKDSDNSLSISKNSSLEFETFNNLIPSDIKNFCYDSEEDIRFLEELLIYDSIPFPDNEASDFDFKPNSGEVISAVMYDNDELKCFDPGSEIDVSTNVEEDNYFPFIFVIRIFLPYLIYPEVSPLLLFVGSEDTIFDPGIFV